MRFPLFLTALFLSSVAITPEFWSEPNQQETVYELEVVSEINHALDLRTDTKARSASVDSFEDTIVLMIEPSDAWHYPWQGKSEMESILFDETENSLARYFLENSRDQTRISGDVTDWIKISRTIQQCDEETSSGEYLTDICIEEAVRLVDSTIDFSDYDRDNDGTVENIMIIFNAPDESRGETWRTAQGAIWPHAFSTYISTNDGVTIRDFFVCTYSCPLGTHIHEYAHNFNLPDLYDVDYSSSGIGEWGIMSSGGHLDFSGENNPSHFSAWSKIELGWVEPIVVQPTDSGTYTLFSSNDGGDIIKVPIGDNQHFLIEYRDTDAAYYDRGLANSGVLIWHINEAKCFDGYNTDNADEWNPCVRLIQADDANELERGYNRGDSTDVFQQNMNFNDQSSPPSHRHDGSNTGLQLTILSINEAYDYAEVHFGELTSWFFSMTAVPNDSNGDGFNNEIIFNYDPDSDGNNVDIEVVFEFYSADRSNFVTSFEYEHTISGSEWDEFEQDIGYYNPGSNGMFWVEAYLWSDGNLCDSVIFGNLWIEYPDSMNLDDESIENVIWEMRDTSGDGFNDSVRVHYDLTSTSNYITQGDLSLRIYSQTDSNQAASIYLPSIEVANGSSGFIDMAFSDTNLKPGRLSGQLTLYVDGDREEVVSTTTIDAFWQSFYVENLYVELVDFDQNGFSDTISLDASIDHSYIVEEFIQIEMNLWDPENFNGVPLQQWIFNHRVGPFGEYTHSHGHTHTHTHTSTQTQVYTENNGVGLFSWELNSEVTIENAYLEFRVIQPDGRDDSEWIYYDSDSNDIDLFPLDWPVTLYSEQVMELDEDFDGSSDTLRVIYDLDTTTSELDVMVGLEVIGPSSTIFLSEIIKLNGSQTENSFIDVKAWESGTYSLHFTATDLTDDTTPVSITLGSFSLNPEGGVPSVSIDIESINEIQITGNECTLSLDIHDSATDLYEFASTVNWQGTPNSIPEGVRHLDCSGWSVGTYNLQVEYSNSFGQNADAEYLLEIFDFETPDVSHQIVGDFEEVGTPCSLTITATSFLDPIPEEDIQWSGIPDSAPSEGSMQDCTNWDEGTYLIQLNVEGKFDSQSEMSFNLVRLPSIDNAENSLLEISQKDEFESSSDGLFITFGIAAALLIVAILIIKISGRKRKIKNVPELNFEEYNSQYQPMLEQELLHNQHQPMYNQYQDVGYNQSSPYSNEAIQSSHHELGYQNQPTTDSWEEDGYHWRYNHHGQLEYYDIYQNVWLPFNPV